MSQGVEFNRLMLEMRSMQTEAMARPQARSAAEAGETDDSAALPSFSAMLDQAIDSVNETQQAAKEIATAFELGQDGADLTEVMIASQKASVSFQAVTQVRNKVVQAYQDIMQMQV